MTRLTPGRVLIVDACPLLCDGLSSCVSRAEHVLIGQAPLADDAARMLATESVDLVIVGPHIAEHEAFNLCRRLESHTQLRTIVIVGPTTDLHVHADAAFIGITACLNYDITCVELLTVMAMVTSGYRLLSGAHDQVGTG